MRRTPVNAYGSGRFSNLECGIFSNPEFGIDRLYTNRITSRFLDFHLSGYPLLPIKREAARFSKDFLITENSVYELWRAKKEELILTPLTYISAYENNSLTDEMSAVIQ